MPVANYRTAADVFESWRESVLTGEAPILYSVGDGELRGIEVGPNLVTLFGGPPGQGKTAITMQFMVDALRLNPELQGVVCNVETTPEVLLDRQLARLSGISAKTIRYRQLDASHANRLECGLDTLESIVDRLCFVRPPFDLDNIAATVDEFNDHKDRLMLLLDYIQRIAPPGQHGDRRGSVDATMNYLRQFADAGVAVMVVSAVSRQRDRHGRSTYGGDSLSLASFRESSELEFGADDAFMLAHDEKAEGIVVLRHLKARHSEPRDIRLRFDRNHQSFMAETPSNVAHGDGQLQASVARLWQQTRAAGEDDDAEGDDA